MGLVQPMSEAVEHVLVVEDDELIRRLVARVLSCHYVVDAVATAEQALDKIAKGAHYDVVVCDICLPGMDGRTFIDVVAERERAAAPRTVFITASSSSMVAPLPCLEKPFSMKDLLAAIRYARTPSSSMIQPAGGRADAADDTGPEAG